MGRDNGFYWRERYQPDGRGGVTAVGPNTYCEYPANLIRIVQRFLLGVDFQRDGTLLLGPTVTDEFRRKGFGQTLRWRERSLNYKMSTDRITGTYEGGDSLRLGVRWPLQDEKGKFEIVIDGRHSPAVQSGGWVFITLPKADSQRPVTFAIIVKPASDSR